MPYKIKAMAGKPYRPSDGTAPSDDEDIGILNRKFECSECGTLYLVLAEAFECHRADVKFGLDDSGEVHPRRPG